MTFEEGQSVLPPAQIEIDIQKILEQVNNPADILQEYVPDATMSGGIYNCRQHV